LAQRVHFFLKAPKVALQSRATRVVNSVLASEAHNQRKRKATHRKDHR
jgi:hypothetical protein